MPEWRLLHVCKYRTWQYLTSKINSLRRRHGGRRTVTDACFHLLLSAGMDQSDDSLYAGLFCVLTVDEWIECLVLRAARFQLSINGGTESKPPIVFPDGKRRTVEILLENILNEFIFNLVSDVRVEKCWIQLIFLPLADDTIYITWSSNHRSNDFLKIGSNAKNLHNKASGISVVSKWYLQYY
jgi:hypothetical protein